MQLSRKLILLIAFLVIAVLLAVFSWQAMAIRRQSEYHEYRYGVSISAPSVLENCTLLLPVPSVGNRSLPGEALARGDGYSVPQDWGLSLVQVNDTPMLRVFAPAIIPEYHGYPIAIEPGSTPGETPPPAATAYTERTPVMFPVDFGVSLKGADPIDTRDPFGREPLFAPPESYSPARCRWPHETGQCYRFPARIFASCRNSGIKGNLTLSITGGGTNQWWLGGWSGNSYSETMEMTVEDLRQGWVTGEGYLDTGSGSYS
jgi:hypothetical protein